MSRRTTILLHVAIWTVLFLSPLSFLNHGNGVEPLRFLMLSMAPLLTMLVFYADYLWLTPKYFVTGEKKVFWAANVIMVVGLGVALHYWMSYTHELFMPAKQTDHYEPGAIDIVLFILRDIFNLGVAAAIATTIHLAMRWQHSEEARIEAEAARTEAELRNLRSQINPHFLLNTLNNIYALTAFDTERAQQAIEQLSKLLRHMLYDHSGEARLQSKNQQQEVKLEDEVQFLENYVNLMKIRLPQTVDVRFESALPADGRPVMIAPLLFVSLVENAFKHGISPTESSFIHLRIEADAQQITCDIKNSNHPKNEQDRSGHGIGLQQVQRRLDLAYPNRYTWQRGASADGKTYHSRICITPQKT